MKRDSSGHSRDNSLPLRDIDYKTVEERITSWADSVKDDRANVEDWPACDRDLAEVIRFIRGAVAPRIKPLVLGLVCYDEDGKPWVYIGHRTTTIDSHSHCFAKCYQGQRSLAAPVWSYEAANLETIARKFPSLLDRSG